MQQNRDDRSLTELVAALSRDTSALIRQEVAIARTEIMQKAYGMGKDVGFIVAGGGAAYAGFLALIAALIIALRKAGLSWWLSAFVGGSLTIGAGAALILKGVTNLRQADLMPTETIETLKENTEWAKNEMT